MNKRWIVLILVVYLALGTLYTVATPLFEAPDEVWHYLYVKHYADGNGLPVYQEGTQFPMEQEASQPPLFYLLNGLASSWIDTSDADQVVQYNPHAAIGTTLPYGNRNMVAHTGRESFPYRGTTLAVHVVRLVCVLLGAGTILCTAGIAATLFPTLPWLPVVAAALNAFNPQFVFIHSSVSNDVLVTFLSSCALWMVALIWRKGASHLRLVLLGTVDPFGLKLMFSVIPIRDQTFTVNGTLSELSGLFKSFWAVFGWFNITVENLIYWLLGLATLLGCLGMILLLARSRTRLFSGAPRRVSDIGRIPLFLLGCWAVAYLLGALYWMRTISTQGRLAFPGISAVSILLALGLAQLTTRRLRPIAPGVLAISLLCLALVVPHRYISPAYARPATLTTDEFSAIVTGAPLSPPLGGKAQLLNYSLSSTTVRPGSSLWVTLYWQADASLDRNYSVFVHLVDDRGVILAQHDSWPGGGNDPTGSWLPGEPRRDIHRLDVPAALLAQGPYRLIVGMYDWETGGRLQIQATSGAVLDAVVLPGELAVEGQSGPALLSLAEVFGQQISLTGYTVEPIVTQPGSSLRVTLRWQALKRPQRNYTVFVHLVGEGGQIGGQADHVPVNGTRSTLTWIAGEVVTETFDVTVSTDAPPDRYTLQVGLYDLETMTRLKLSQGADVITLGQIQVRD